MHRPDRQFFSHDLEEEEDEEEEEAASA